MFDIFQPVPIFSLQITHVVCRPDGQIGGVPARAVVTVTTALSSGALRVSGPRALNIVNIFVTTDGGHSIGTSLNAISVSITQQICSFGFFMMSSLGSKNLSYIIGPLCKAKPRLELYMFKDQSHITFLSSFFFILSLNMHLLWNYIALVC